MRKNCALGHIPIRNSRRSLKKSGEVSKQFLGLHDAGSCLSGSRASDSVSWEGLVTRALRSNSLWLVVTYVGLILLMARAYA